MEISNGENRINEWCLTPCTYIFLAKHEVRTRRILALGLDRTDRSQFSVRTKKIEVRLSPSTIPSKPVKKETCYTNANV